MPTENDSTAANSDGTQAIRRAAAILRRIGRDNAQGVGLSAIAQTVKLPRSTTHRILKCLVEEGLVHHDTERRRYLVGRLTYELGLAVTPDTLEIGRWRAAVERTARRTGVTSYLLGRSGIEAACLLKTDGNSIIRVIPVEVGQRRMLGVGAGSTALLAALDPETAERLIAAVAPDLAGNHDLTADVIRELVAEARETGFAVSRAHVVRDVIGVGMAIPAAEGPPTLALSIAGLASQVDEKLLAEWKQIIREEIAAVLDG